MKVVAIQVCTRTQQSTVTLRSMPILFGQWSPVTSEQPRSTCLCICWSCALWVLRGAKESLMGWVMMPIDRTHSCRTQAICLCQDVCERMCSLYCAINTPIYNAWTDMVLSETVLCTAVKNSIERCKWLSEAILDWIFSDSSYSLAQSHECFLLGAHVRKLVDTERWECEKLQQLSRAASTNNQTDRCSISQSAAANHQTWNIQNKGVECVNN